MSLLRFATPALALLFAATAAQATPLPPIPHDLPPQQVQLKLTAHSGVASGNYYVGPYKGSVSAYGYSMPVELYCVDYLHQATVGTPAWNVYASMLRSGNLGRTVYGNDELVNYRKAAWLTTQYSAANTGEWGNIQKTIWNLFTASEPTAPNPGSDYWRNLVDANYASAALDYRQFFVLSDVAGDVKSAKQEYLVRVPFPVEPEPLPPGTVTPEPGTLLLMASGLLGVLGVGLRRLA